jgi:cation diffusion facilitator CzcD-associated flavoprotein CzcO
VLERHDDVGGTWWANTYPGCACDVPSHLYSFSFAPNPEWSQTYTPQPEIRAYLQRCAISEVRERSIVCEDGSEREVDTIIFGTGFHVTDMPIGH